MKSLNRTGVNYLMSGIGDPRLTRKPPFIQQSSYPFKNSSLTEVNKNQLIWPPGMEKWKGLFGQRIY